MTETPGPSDLVAAYNRQCVEIDRLNAELARLWPGRPSGHAMHGGGPEHFSQWLERRFALAEAAIKAAQEVIGQCDCGMDEPPPNPKHEWRRARDAYYSHGGGL